MTTVSKEYKIKLPFTLKEWRKGSRYILTKLTTPEVQIIKHMQRAESNSLITETHKVLNLKKKIPSLIRKVIPEDACTVDEYSINIEIVDGKEIITDEKMKNKDGIIKDFEVKGDIEINNNKSDDTNKSSSDGINNNTNSIDGINTNSNEASSVSSTNKQSSDGNQLTDEINNNLSVTSSSSNNSCSTVYKNRYFNSETFSMEVKTFVTQEEEENPFKIEKKYKKEEINFANFKNKKIGAVGDRNYEGDWSAKYPHVYCYKMLDIKINSFMLGWIANEVEKMVKDLLVDVQTKLVETYDEWKDLTEEDIVKLESEMVAKFIAKESH